MTGSSGSLRRALRGPSRSEHSRSPTVQRSRSRGWCVPVHARGTLWPSLGRLKHAPGGCGHEKRVYLSGAGVVEIIAALLCVGLGQKLLIRRQFGHVTILQDYLEYSLREIIEIHYFTIFSFSNTALVIRSTTLLVCDSQRCAYRLTMARVLCPSSSAISSKLAPFMAR